MPNRRMFIGPLQTKRLRGSVALPAGFMPLRCSKSHRLPRLLRRPFYIDFVTDLHLQRIGGVAQVLGDFQSARAAD